MSGLKREKDALLKIVGQLTVDQGLGKKSSIAMAVNQTAPFKSKRGLAKECGETICLKMDA
ncbi:MAG: hypothetical protein ACP5IX_00170 [Patescibacteria group bacterium]